MQENSYGSASGYGKRPLWQWILLYVVIGGLIYGLVYYFVFAKKGGYTTNSGDQTSMYGTQQSSSPATSAAPTTMTYGSPSPVPSLKPVAFSLMTKTNTAKGKYLTDSVGMSLYLFDKDTQGVSTCYDQCEVVWPPLLQVGAEPGKL